jgi:hypothetical protein
MTQPAAMGTSGGAVEAALFPLMNADQYPGLFRYADSASLSAQATYLQLQRAYLLSLIVGSVAGALTSLRVASLNAMLYTTMAAVLMIGLLILWIMRARQDDRVWFDGRAVAESVKTVTWRFMMKVPPFDDDAAASNLFLSQLREIRQARPHLGKHIAAAQEGDSVPITTFMRERRSEALEERKAFYVAHRLSEQRGWYAKKARLNAQASTRWFWIVTGLQAVALVFAIAQAVSRGQLINIVPALTTCAAAFAAWGQLKRHDELAQSYALAAQELEELAALASEGPANDEFPQLIEQAENSISREHTMWCARRDVRIRSS